MNNFNRLTIIFWLVVFNHLVMFGQHFIKTDTSDVDVLAVFYYSGDLNAFENNYFGMVILEKTGKLDKLIPASKCSYQYYSTKDKANEKIHNIISKYYVANVPPASNGQHVVFYWSLLKNVWGDSSNTWKDTISFLSSQVNMHKNDSELLSGIDCFTDPFWDDCFHYGATPERYVDVIGGGQYHDNSDFRQAGFYYQRQQIRMAYLIIEDNNDSILRLAYYNPLVPLFPKPDFKWATPDTPVKYKMGNVCATHLHSFEKNGISRVAAPYMYEALSFGNPPQSKSKLNKDVP